MTDALARLSELGVSVWLDDLSRELLAGGELERLIRDKHVVGVTTNPTIFASALAEGRPLRRPGARSWRPAAPTSTPRSSRSPRTTSARRATCSSPSTSRPDHVDGRVSIEVDPRLAHDTAGHRRGGQAAVDDGRPPERLHQDPGDRGRGCRRSPQVLAEGISVNVTLIFSLDRYRAVMNAYLEGLERAKAKGIDVARSPPSRPSSSPASTPRSTSGSTRSAPTRPRQLRGKAGIANARLAYQAYEEVLAGERWKTLAAAGARVQRPLWASTGVKDPAYPDTMYVTELVAPDTVNTMPSKTLDAVADHGEITGETDPRAVRRGRARCWTELERLGIGYNEVDRPARARGRRQVREELDRTGPDRQRRARARPRRAPRAPGGGRPVTSTDWEQGAVLDVAADGAAAEAASRHVAQLVRAGRRERGQPRRTPRCGARPPGPRRRSGSPG